MNLSQYIDATILDPAASLLDYENLCCDAIKYRVKAICVPPSAVSICKGQLEGYGIRIASVVGFPNGYQLLNTKLNEIEDLIELGVDEIDFVINRFYLSIQNWNEIYQEAKEIINHCKLRGIVVKWIIECSLLDENAIIQICKIAEELHPDFVKTSTGVHGQAKLENVFLLRKNLCPSIQIKASGGIRTREQAEAFINAGATRLGVSRFKEILESGEKA